MFAGAGSNFFERVLDAVPTPVLVLDEEGTVVYGNELLRRLTGWSMEEGIGKSVFEAIHPDDADIIMTSFGHLAGDDPGPEWLTRPWAPTHFRMVDRWGNAIPVEVTGRTMLHDPDVQAIVYEVRPAHERELFQRVITGIASGGSFMEQLGLIVDLVDASNMAIDSVVVRRDRHGTCEALAASPPGLLEIVADAARDGEAMVVDGLAPDPVFVDVADLTGDYGHRLRELGYRDAWYVDTADEVDTSDALDGGCCRIVAFTVEHNVPQLSVIDRLRRGAELASFLAVRERSRQRLEHAAHHDWLTGLPNRLGLEERLDGDRRKPARGTGELTVLFVDLDGFKTVNDQHGHATGDAVLRVVAQRLEAATRAGDLVARLGGDEFAVLLGRGSGSEKDIDDVVARIVSVVAEPIPVGGVEHHLTASVGTIDASSNADIGAVIAAADRAMYEAKRAGGDRAHRGVLRAD